MTDSVTDIDVALMPYRDAFTKTMWASMLLDAEWRIRWVSDELRDFVTNDPTSDMGIGTYLAEALLRSPWIDAVHPDSVLHFLEQFGPYAAWDAERRGTQLHRIVPQELSPLLETVAPEEAPLAWGTTFRYMPPNRVTEDGYPVDVLFVRLFDADREIGAAALFDIGVPPHLVALLARGDRGMYERMARLVEPGHREAAILFCDLHGSGTLSRRLPTAEYFSLVSRLWRGVDEAVSRYGGIVGKHAGDGATAFFLAEDVGGRSAAARAALLTARAIHEVGEDVFRNVTADGCLMKVGLHWGPNLFMGQLVPGGRLDVTALGDEVNEAARIQEAARAHQTLASKQLLEGLTAAHAQELDVATSSLSYRLLSEVAPDAEKIVRDAGTLAVAEVPN